MDFKNAFAFLEKLAKNNDREWFQKNKEKFLTVKADFEEFVTLVYHHIAEFDESLDGQDPKKLVFRIYRDVRFSKDKRPYKKFLSAGFSSEGKGMGKPGYYLQLEPGNKSFLCTGLFAPPADILTKVRQEIDYNGDRLRGIINEKSFKKNFEKFWEDDKLKTAPKGYAKDHPYIEWLKLKSFVVMHRFSDTEVFSKGFDKKVASTIKVGKPLNDFLRQAMD